MRNRDKIPAAATLDRPKAYQAEPDAEILSKWAQTVLAEGQSPTEITIYEAIGEDFWTGGGWTPSRMDAALKAAGGKDVKVLINSPGGDVFDGIAIFNQLRNYDGAVDVEVMGIAASAASVIAMAGDTITMALGSTMMIHNAWGVVVGNKNDLAQAVAALDKIDGSLKEIYAARTGMGLEDITAMMDAETFLSGQEAVDKGFADAVDAALAPKKAEDNPKNRALLARRQTEAALAKSGKTRAKRDAILNDLAPRDASQPAARDAGDLAALSALVATFKGINTDLRS